MIYCVPIRLRDVKRIAKNSIVYLKIRDIMIICH